MPRVSRRYVIHNSDSVIVNAFPFAAIKYISRDIRGIVQSHARDKIIPRILRVRSRT